MTAVELISHLKGLGVSLSVAEGRLVFDAPRGVIDEELRAQLVQNKQQLVTLLTQATSPGSQTTSISRSDRQSVVPVSPAQERIWTLSQLLPTSAVYNLPLVFRICGDLNVEALSKAVDFVCQRHEILRTRIATTTESVEQIIEDEPLGHLSLDDLAKLSDIEQQTAEDQIVDEIVRRPFNMSEGPLIRTHLIRLSNKECIFVLVMHHIISDGWSFNVYLEELQNAYNRADSDAVELQNLPFQYADYSAWKHELNKSEKLKHQLEYWSNKLGGNLAAPELPVAQENAYKNFKGCRITRTLSHELSQQVRELAVKNGIPVSTILLSLFKILLHAGSGQTDIVVCVPVIGRSMPGAGELIGCFSDIVLLRTDLSGTPSFDEIVARVRKTTSEAMDNCEVPMQLVLQQSEKLTRLPIRVMFNHAGTNQHSLNLDGLEVKSTPIHCGEVTFDLAMTSSESESTIDISFDYKDSLFRELTIEHLLDDFETLADQMCRYSTRTFASVINEFVPQDINITGRSNKSKQEQEPPSKSKDQYVAPQTASERKLVRIWESVFNLSPIGTNDHFFRLGGYSWLSFVVLAEIETAFQIKLPVATFETHQTVKQLAGHIDKCQSDSASISDQLHLPPHVKRWRILGPGGPGNYLFYSDITHDSKSGKTQIETRAQRFQTEYSSITTMEDMARRCIEEIKSMQPNGPYYLLGQVCGTNMAIEVGRLLIEAGEQVPLTAVFDASPQLVAKSVWNRYFKHSITLLRSGNISYLWRRMIPSIRYQFRRLLSRTKSSKLKNSASDANANKAAGEKSDSFSYTVVQSNYLPKTYPGRFVMFLSQEFASTPQGKSSLNSARSLAQERLEVVILPGDKRSEIMDTVYLPHLIAALDK